MGSRQARARLALNSVLLAAVVLSACAPNRPATSSSEASPGAPQAAQAPLVVFTGKEPASVATRALLESSISLRTTQRMFNALPALLDARGTPQPELLVSLPSGLHRVKSPAP